MNAWPSTVRTENAVLGTEAEVGRGLLVHANDTHLVQFYEDEEFLCRTVCEFVAAGVASREPIVIIATAAHRELFVRKLNERALDTKRAITSGQLTLLDAEDTLSLLMRDDTPDWESFQLHVGGVVRQARARSGERQTRAYGEMVDVLWKAGNRQAALRLEEMWNELAKSEKFALLCGYSMNNFRGSDDGGAFHLVCDAHSHSLPTETFAALSQESERLREVAVLQQRALAWEGELANRRKLEGSLRESETELQEFLGNATEGIHLVGPDGTILYANKAELDLLGYSKGEYIGQHIGAFHADAQVIQDILTRLCAGEALVNYEARLRCKDGSIKHVLINSNVRFQDGKFLHTRCFTRDITDRKRWEERLSRAEERFRRMLEATPDGVGVTVPLRNGDGKIVDFKYVYVNPVVAKAMGRPAEDLVGRTLLEVLPRLDQTPFWEAFCRVADSGVPEIYEQPYRENGWSGWFRNVVVSLGEEIAVAYSDITQRKRAEDGLRFLSEASTILASSLDYDTTLASVAKLAIPTIADWSSVDMLVPDGGVKRLAIAHSDPDKLGIAREIQRRRPVDLDAPHGLGRVLRTGQPELIAEISEAIVAEGASDADTVALIRSLGLKSSMSVPLRSRGRVVGALTLVSAESGRRYTAEDLRLAEDLAGRASIAIENANLYRAAEEANQAKDEFLAVVSHELRTPLNAIIGWTHMLREDSFPPDRRQQALETIERNAKNQHQLIEDLLDVSRIVSGKLRLDVDTVDPALVIERAVETVRPAATAKNITIRQLLDPNATPVYGDPDRLQQVIWNLLSNAVKFSPKGTEVHVVLRKLESSVEIIVKDRGSGIEPAFLPYVFERFRQAESGTTRTKAGLGLGLAIVRKLVELHGGTVKAESAGLGHGASFSVCLPISAVRSSSYGRPPPVQLVAPAPVLACPPELQGIHVLVVDDEEDARDLLSALLGRCHVRVSTAASVAEALPIIEATQPSIVVSDIGMPEEDGYSLIRRLRGLPPAQGGKTPAVALTAYARVEERTKALVAGFNMHLSKPVEPTELLAVLASLTALLPADAGSNMGPPTQADEPINRVDERWLD